MAHSFGTLDELGDNYGFRKIRQGLDKLQRRRSRGRLSVHDVRERQRHAYRQPYPTHTSVSARPGHR